MRDLKDLPAIAFGTRVRTTPYHDATRRWGCSCYTVYNHTYLPVFYESPIDDYNALINDVSLWDVGCQRQVEIAGPDAARFVQYLTPRNLADCKVGQCKYVLLTAYDGGIVNDPVLLKLAEDRFWLSLADSDVLLWAKGVALHGEWDVTIHEPDVSPVQVQGPKSTDVMRDVFGEWIDDLKYFWFREIELDGVPLAISRTGWSGERGYEIYLRDGSQGDWLWERIMDAGKSYGIKPGAPSAIRRIEAGILSYGADMDLTNNPFEINMDRLVDTDMEADYIGKEALQRIKEAGVPRRLVGIEIAGSPLPAPNVKRWPVYMQEIGIGHVTSCVHSPTLQKNVGFALLAHDWTSPGTEIRIEAEDGERSAHVVALPFTEKRQNK